MWSVHFTTIFRVLPKTRNLISTPSFSPLTCLINSGMLQSIRATAGYGSQKHTVSLSELTMIGFGRPVNVLPLTVDYQALTGCTGYIKTLK